MSFPDAKYVSTPSPATADILALDENNLTTLRALVFKAPDSFSGLIRYTSFALVALLYPRRYTQSPNPLMTWHPDTGVSIIGWKFIIGRPDLSLISFSGGTANPSFPTAEKSIIPLSRQANESYICESLNACCFTGLMTTSLPF